MLPHRIWKSPAHGLATRKNEHAVTIQNERNYGLNCKIRKGKPASASLLDII
jgi:hypothetical protein